MTITHTDMSVPHENFPITFLYALQSISGDDSKNLPIFDSADDTQRQLHLSSILRILLGRILNTTSYTPVLQTPTILAQPSTKTFGIRGVIRRASYFLLEQPHEEQTRIATRISQFLPDSSS